MTYPQVQVIPNQSGPRLLWQVFVNRNPQAAPNDPTWEMLQEFSCEDKARSFAAEVSSGDELHIGQYVWVEGKLTDTQPENFPKRVRVYIHGVGTGVVGVVKPVHE